MRTLALAAAAALLALAAVAGPAHAAAPAVVAAGPAPSPAFGAPGAPAFTAYPLPPYSAPRLASRAGTTSPDGGRAWLPFTEVTGGCGGLHGHIRVSEATGFAAVPDASCATGEGTVPGVPMGPDKVGFGYT